MSPADITQRARELRAAGAAKSAAHRAARHGGVADVVVVRGGAQREGLTEDYLTVIPTDPGIPRGTRFRARLALADGALFASAEAL